ncbi:MAG: type II toxin-antitoxin system HicB family antitoxin [bacterium]
MNEYTIIIEKGESDNFVGSVLELPGCHTQAKTIDQLMKHIKEAIELYLEVEKPEYTSKFLGIQRINV